MDNNVFVLSNTHSIASQFLMELRDTSIQKDRMRFRKNMERLGQILGYEVSKRFLYAMKNVTTPLGEISVEVLKDNPILVTILRAGIPFWLGFQQLFDAADSGFIGAYRNEQTGSVTISLDYLSVPSVDKRTIILIDPMLATGRSLLDAVKVLSTKGTPSHVHIVSVVAAPEGLKLLKDNLTLPYSLWTCAIDEKLNSDFYIVPGLGDAGDLSYGIKA